MRICLILLAALLLCGCFSKKAEPQFPPVSGANSSQQVAGASGNPKLIVTPGKSLVGKVAFVHPTARFVVINFPVGHLPAVEQHFNLYRAGLKVGEAKITGPQYDDNVVADLLSGESEIGDQARDR
jgi:hypothetical protein